MSSWVCADPDAYFKTDHNWTVYVSVTQMRIIDNLAVDADVAFVVVAYKHVGEAHEAAQQALPQLVILEDHQVHR